MLKEACSDFLMAAVNDMTMTASRESLQDIISQEAIVHTDAFEVDESYDFDRSTAENYGSEENNLVGDFVDIRETLDYSYHPFYDTRRQLLQDQLLKNVISSGRRQAAPWIVFTAGAMGAGKSFTIRWMNQNEYFPLSDIVQIDPDQFKSAMPEWRDYIHNSPLDAGSKTHLESGFLVEIAQEKLLSESKNIQVDGSLRDYKWYQIVFQKIKERYPHYNIAILYIYASKESVYRRVEARSRVTGRHVPKESIDQSLEQVPFSVEQLKPYCDFVAYIENEGEPKLINYYDQLHPTGAKNPSWSLVKNKFPSHDPELRAECQREIDDILQQYDVVLFSKSWCTFSDRIKDLLASLNVQMMVAELDSFESIEKTIVMQMCLVQLSSTHTVPQLYYRGQFIGDSSTITNYHEEGVLGNYIPLNEDPVSA